MATAFGPEGCILIHLLAEIEPRVRVFNLDTGYQFPETLALRDQIAERYGIEVEMVRPDTTVAEYEQAARRTALRIELRPVLLRSQDRSVAACRWSVTTSWITAIRADQSSHRAEAKVVGWDAKFGLVKINPLLSWTSRDVWAFIVANRVPYNPLHDQGYPSIGCWPCTRPWPQAGRARGTMGGTGQDRVRAAFAGQQPALSRAAEGPWRGKWRR